MATETEVPEILAQFDQTRSSLIPILQEIQNKYRYLPQAALRQVARS